MTLLEKLTRAHPVGTVKRWELIADLLGTGRSGEEVAAHTKATLGSTTKSSQDDYAIFLASRKGTGEVKAEGGASTRETAFTDVAPAAATAGGWTAEQDLALVQAIKAHPKSEGVDEKTRWVAIAVATPGGHHSAAECIRRVAALREESKSKASAEKYF